MHTAIVFDIDGVLRDVSRSYRRALADTVEHFTAQVCAVPWRPDMAAIDALKQEGQWNNDWQGSQELIYRAYEQDGGQRRDLDLDYATIVSFFQARYRGQGSRPTEWDGYISQEPLLVTQAYFETLTAAGFAWGFFSGATRASALFTVQQRLGIAEPVLYAMEDGPEKPDPTGLFQVVHRLESRDHCFYQRIVYCGDTVADMQVIQRARPLDRDRDWLGVGLVPPHVTADQVGRYSTLLRQQGADQVYTNVEALTPLRLATLG